MELLELAERLADLHVRRARLRELEEKTWNLSSNFPDLREKGKIYRAANKALSAEIRRLEGLIEQGL
jgi:hypothetical protein